MKLNYVKGTLETRSMHKLLQPELTVVEYIIVQKHVKFQYWFRKICQFVPIHMNKPNYVNSPILPSHESLTHSTSLVSQSPTPSVAYVHCHT